MSGTERLFFDTNAAIALLAGDAALQALWRQIVGWVERSEAQQAALHEPGLHVGLPASAQPTKLRRARALKLPDAVVLASAKLDGATLISRDARLLKAAEDVGIGVWRG